MCCGQLVTAFALLSSFKVLGVVTGHYFTCGLQQNPIREMPLRVENDSFHLFFAFSNEQYVFNLAHLG